MLWRLDSLSKVNYNKYCFESCNLAGFMNLYGFCCFGYSFGGHILVGGSVLVRRVDLCRSVHKSSSGQGESTAYQYSGSHMNSITKPLFVSRSVKRIVSLEPNKISTFHKTHPFHSTDKAQSADFCRLRNTHSLHTFLHSYLLTGRKRSKFVSESRFT